MRPKRVGVSLGLALLVSLAAAAEVRAEESSCTVGRNDEARRNQARENFLRGQELFDSANFPGAMAAFECSFQNVPRAATLYNIARSAELAGEFERALDAWRGYLRMNPEAEDRAEIEARIAGLEASIEAANRANEAAAGQTGGQTQQPVQPTWTPPASETPSTQAAPQSWETPSNVPSNVYTPRYGAVDYERQAQMRYIGIGVGSSGALIAVLGLFIATPLLELAGSGTCAEVESESELYATSGETNPVTPECQTAGWVLVGVGGAAILSGILVYVLGGRSRASRASLVPSLALDRSGGVSGGSALFSYRF